MASPKEVLSKIHINNMGVQQFAAHVLANKEANFAKNATKFKH